MDGCQSSKSKQISACSKTKVIGVSIWLAR